MIYFVNIMKIIYTLEEDNILTKSLCTQLGEKQKTIYNQFKTYTKRAGTRKTRKLNRKKKNKETW